MPCCAPAWPCARVLASRGCAAHMGRRSCHQQAAPLLICPLPLLPQPVTLSTPLPAPPSAASGAVRRGRGGQRRRRRRGGGKPGARRPAGRSAGEGWLCAGQQDDAAGGPTSMGRRERCRTFQASFLHPEAWGAACSFPSAPPGQAAPGWPPACMGDAVIVLVSVGHERAPSSCGPHWARTFPIQVRARQAVAAQRSPILCRVDDLPSH